MTKYEEWKKRKEGFFNSIDSGTTPLDPEVQGLFELQGCLKGFVTELFDFFLDGFFGSLAVPPKEEIRLIPSIEHPPEFVLRKILHQASFDLNVIQRAIAQRDMPPFKDELKKFDDLARLAIFNSSKLDPDSSRLINPVKPFVYFQRDTSVRIVPYAKALLIGVPYMALEQPLDILSIPHEIGHHVYQGGYFSPLDPVKLSIEKQFADKPVWLRAWLEEIFADIYGFLVAGPITGFTIQNILLDNLPSGLVEDDGTHPVGVIRPFIYIKLLNLTKNAGLANLLEKNWKAEKKNKGIAQLKHLAKTTEINEQDARTEIESVVKEMYESIKQYMLETTWTPQFNNNSSDSSIQSLCQSFNIANTISSNKNKIDLLNAHFEDNNAFTLKEGNKYWLTNQIAYWKDPKNEVPPLEPNIWRLIFTAFNWADQPDETRPVHGPETL